MHPKPFPLEEEPVSHDLQGCALDYAVVPWRGVLPHSGSLLLLLCILSFFFFLLLPSLPTKTRGKARITGHHVLLLITTTIGDLVQT